MDRVEVLNLTSICRNFPKSPVSEVSRDHLLDTIDRTFEAGTNILIVEGCEGIGKTIFLAQYAKRHAENAVSLFIAPLSRYAYSPEYLKLILSEQIHWALHKEQVNPNRLNEAFMSTQISLLQRRALRNREVFYFIIDGLQDLPAEDIRIQDIILHEILPIGLDGFQFLISGDFKKLPLKGRKDVLCKSFQLPYFSLDETKRYFRDMELNSTDLEDIHRMCHGIPEHLASVMRSISSGVDIQKIFDEDPDNLPSFLSIEWRKIREATEAEKNILALITFGRKKYSTHEIARILNQEQSHVQTILNNLSIIRTDSDNGCIDFVSESMRKFASKHLHEYKEKMTNLLIDDLLQDSDTEEKIVYLPDYYEQAGRLDELLAYLTPEHFAKVLEMSHSLYPLRLRAEMGLTSSQKQKQNQDNALIRFSMQKSLITELEKAETWRSEVEARMALKDYNSALALAHSTILKEDKLHLLTIIAKFRCKEGLRPEPELINQIDLLYNQIDHRSLGPRATEIASDLIWVNPDLAINLINTAMDFQFDKEEYNWAFAKLSVLALVANYNENLPSEIAEQTRSQIRDSSLHKFAKSVSMFFGDFSSAEVIEHAEKIEIQNRLFFIRSWAIANQDREDAANVIDYALDILVKNTPYTPKMRDLRETAIPLPYVKDRDRAKHLVGRFDSLRGTIEALGTSVDYVRLQLLLAYTESKYDSNAAYNRVLELYWFVGNIADLSTKTECLAHMISTLNEIDPDGIMETKEGIFTVTKDELRLDIKKLLNNTADHFSIVRGTIQALSISTPDVAFEIAQSLNTAIRRDLATLEFVESVIRARLSDINLEVVRQAIEKIDDVDFKDEAFLKVMQKLFDSQECFDLEVVNKALFIIKSLNEMRSANHRCLAYCFAYGFLKRQNAPEFETLLSNLLADLDKAWKVHDVGWLKINTGFKIARAFATESPDLAAKFLKLTEQVKEVTFIHAEKPALVFIACLKLAIRAFGGLLPKNINTSADIERLSRLIDFIPSKVERAGLWADIALLCFAHNRSEDGSRIVSCHLKPLLSDIPDDKDKDQVLISSAAALYYAHRQTALEMIRRLPPTQQDEALSEICDFILRKSLPSDPYDTMFNEGYRINYEEAFDICEILKLISTDSIIFNYIEHISDSLFAKHNRANITEQQKVDLAARMEIIIAQKFPDLKNIKHNGYKIVAQAHVARIRRAPAQSWNELIDAARKIPTTADIVYILGVISSIMPSKLSKKRSEIIEEAISLITQINSDLDRTERFSFLGNLLRDVEPSASRKCLKFGIETSLKLDDLDLIYPTQRRIIDLAHKIDPIFAETLVNIVDQDPARKLSRTKNLKKYLDVIRLKDKMADANNAVLDISTPKFMYPKAAWMNLGALNAGRVVPLHASCLVPYIAAAADLPISESYPILAWTIENTVQRLAKTDQARTHIVPIFESTLLGAELASRITIKSSDQVKSLKAQAIELPTISQNIIVKPSERDKAIQFIKDWLVREPQDHLKICDPYFGVEDLEILQVLLSVNAKCSITILTSKKHQLQNNLTQPWDDAFRFHWRKLSDQSPPRTEILIAGFESSGELPIHDRWWLGSDSGLRFGTSFNSLGLTKISEISVLSQNETIVREQEVNQYILREKRFHKNEKIIYTLFSL
jgi:hypothetical protein